MKEWREWKGSEAVTVPQWTRETIGETSPFYFHQISLTGLSFTLSLLVFFLIKFLLICFFHYRDVSEETAGTVRRDFLSLILFSLLPSVSSLSFPLTVFSCILENETCVFSFRFRWHEGGREEREKLKEKGWGEREEWESLSIARFSPQHSLLFLLPYFLCLLGDEGGRRRGEKRRDRKSLPFISLILVPHPKVICRWMWEERRTKRVGWWEEVLCLYAGPPVNHPSSSLLSVITFRLLSLTSPPVAVREVMGAGI